MSTEGQHDGRAPVPDLASVLRALSSSYSKDSSPAVSVAASAIGQRPQIGLDLASIVSGAGHQQQAPPEAAANAGTAGAGSAPGPAVGSPTAAPAQKDTASASPALITTWPAALKYVMKTVGGSEQMQATIRNLIHLQHESERRWSAERHAVLEKQRTRAGKQKQLDDVLRAIGGAVATSQTARTPEEDQRELADTDRKIYSEVVTLSRNIDRDLRTMGIPFFAIRYDLVHQGDNPVAPDASSKGTLSTRELGELQKKMLELLEDLCQE
ncbi:hypothetical protein KEM52_002813 [Ascosphaera acerosa]|nr:hypothetical protein KEM52_002813 [Ascosphaera acerosa]